MLELVIITIINLLCAAWLKNEEFYPDRKIYKILSLVPPLSILYSTILLMLIAIMWLVDTIKNILE